MVHHIVMWTLQEQAQNRSKKENALLFKSKLEALKDVIPEIIKLEVGLSMEVSTSSNFDIVLDSWFESYEGLVRYQNHPDHQKLITWLKDIRINKASVDYQV